jgi:hypothetical protein
MIAAITAVGLVRGPLGGHVAEPGGVVRMRAAGCWRDWLLRSATTVVAGGRKRRRRRRRRRRRDQRRVAAVGCWS